jgi:DNA-binding beta-propeller fold protein YncE
LKKGEVITLVGGDLFDFGDVDGSGDDVRLQHPLGLAKYESSIFIADTYNHKLKVLDEKTSTVKTFLGTGKSGNIDGKTPTFWEPGGISAANGKLFVADTNNQAIRVVDLQTKDTTTLTIKGLTSPK